jgi:hypothetical protein
MPEQQSFPRYRIDETSDQLHIAVSPRRDWLMIIRDAFVAVLSGAVAALCLMFLIRSVYLLAVNQSIPDWFVVFAAIIELPLYGALALISFRGILWKLTGRETIIITPDSIQVERKVFRVQRLPPYRLEEIYDLQPAPRGGIEFTKRDWKSYRIGSELSIEESRQILDRICVRFPQFEQKKKANLLDTLQPKTHAV